MIKASSLIKWKDNTMVRAEERTAAAMTIASTFKLLESRYLKHLSGSKAAIANNFCNIIDPIDARCSC